MTKADLAAAAELWNADYVHDPVTPERLERVIFGDGFYDERGTRVALDGERIVGFACCVAPTEARLGSDAFLKALCSAGYEAGGPANALVQAALDFARARDKETVRVVEYAGGPYLMPGIDVRYADKVAFFLRCGFEQGRELHDMEADLTEFVPSPEQREAEGRVAAAGVCIRPYDPSMLEAMREFVPLIQMPNWFRPGWEEGYRAERTTFVALKDGRIVGYANYRPDSVQGSFGTTAVLPELRRGGIGTCLLAASMLKMKDAGTPKVRAHWTNTPFYLKNGWRICRRYATFRKALRA
jgi:GNAT superfamily N-acetyltransferase